MSQNSEMPPAKRLNADLIIGIVSLGLAALVYFSTRELSKLGGVFVDYTLVALTVLALLTTAKGLVKPERIRFFESVVERNNVLVGICILLLYLIFLPLTGFLPASYAFYFCFNLYLADERFTTRNILSSAALTALVVTAFYFIFHDFLEVPLPEGRWFG
jgi:amino acid transporter